MNFHLLSGVLVLCWSTATCHASVLPPPGPDCPTSIQFMFNLFTNIETSNSCGTGIFLDADGSYPSSHPGYSYSIGPFTDVRGNYAEFNYNSYNFLAGPNPPNYIFAAKLNVPGCPQVMQTCLLVCDAGGGAAACPDDPPPCGQAHVPAIAMYAHDNPGGGGNPNPNNGQASVCEYDESVMDDYLQHGCTTRAESGTSEGDIFCNCKYGSEGHSSHCMDDINNGWDSCERTMCSHSDPDHADLTRCVSPTCDKYDQSDVDNYLLNGCKEGDIHFCTCKFGVNGQGSYCKLDTWAMDACDRAVCQFSSLEDLVPTEGCSVPVVIE